MVTRSAINGALLEPVRNADHSNAPIPQLTDNSKQVSRVLLREQRRWLIRISTLASAPRAPGNLHQLLLRHAQRAGLHLGIDVRASLG
jgi:hypothetical protein